MSKKLTKLEGFSAGVRMAPIFFIVYLPFGLLVNSFYPNVVQYALAKGYIMSPPAGIEYRLWLLGMHLFFSVVALSIVIIGFKILKKKYANK